MIRMSLRNILGMFVILYVVLAGGVSATTANGTVIKLSSEGPIIIPEMPRFIDVIGTGENDTYSLVLRANVTDPNGVKTVIGSYCNRSEGVWHNVTMQLDPHYDGDIYTVTARNYTLTNSNSGVVWDIRFYASDYLGHWSVNTTFQSVNRLWSSQPPASPSPPWYLIAVSAVAVTLLALAVVVFRRRMK